MEEEKVYIDYAYTGLSGMTYRPYFYRNSWYVVPNSPVSFLHMVYLCKIPDEDALLLKLRFGGGGALQDRPIVV